MIHGELLTTWQSETAEDGQRYHSPAVALAVRDSGRQWRVRDSTKQASPPPDPNALIVEVWADPAAWQLMLAAGAYELWSVES